MVVVVNLAEGPGLGLLTTGLGRRLRGRLCVGMAGVGEDLRARMGWSWGQVQGKCLHHTRTVFLKLLLCVYTSENFVANDTL